ncbi:hypothetical protein [Deinococcus roseus]|uniref:Uncharacterized protein n=1 Tax=Deinococcus roseus TaxID=392414 RepID=A0ABQ2D497_9DEIO|nr:hypothetical protein [Deinococcus roseus]GGJ44261.1 hypothetical protein GCM10008938_33130 [Deinococcus roseus]
MKRTLSLLLCLGALAHAEETVSNRYSQTLDVWFSVPSSWPYAPSTDRLGTQIGSRLMQAFSDGLKMRDYWGCLKFPGTNVYAGEVMEWYGKGELIPPADVVKAISSRHPKTQWTEKAPVPNGNGGTAYEKLFVTPWAGGHDIRGELYWYSGEEASVLLRFCQVPGDESMDLIPRKAPERKAAVTKGDVKNGLLGMSASVNEQQFCKTLGCNLKKNTDGSGFLAGSKFYVYALKRGELTVERKDNVIKWVALDFSLPLSQQDLINTANIFSVITGRKFVTASMQSCADRHIQNFSTTGKTPAGVEYEAYCERNPEGNSVRFSLGVSSERSN